MGMFTPGCVTGANVRGFAACAVLALEEGRTAMSADMVLCYSHVVALREMRPCLVLGREDGVASVCEARKSGWPSFRQDSHDNRFGWAWSWVL